MNAEDSAFYARGGQIKGGTLYMKKLLVLLIAAVMALTSVAALADAADFDPELVKAAQAEGELVVYGSCEEPYLAAACQKF